MIDYRKHTIKMILKLTKLDKMYLYTLPTIELSRMKNILLENDNVKIK